MAELRSTQFYKGTISSGSYTTVYTVPTGHRIILKSLALANSSSSTTLVYVIVASTMYPLWSLAARGSAGSVFEWRPWVVLNAGDTIQIACTTGNSVGVIISGAYHYV